MSKQKKKRNKVYRGEDSSVTRPVVTRITAENRSSLKQWWIDHKRIAKPIGKVVGILMILVIIIIGLFSI